MDKVLARWSDRALTAILPKSQAGACVGGAGTTCRCTVVPVCPVNCRTLYNKYILNCLGQCVFNGQYCFCKVG